jgi:hypothetical protein
MRDKLTAELADIYPAVAESLAELLPRIVQNTATSSTSRLARCRTVRIGCSLPS